MKSKISTLLATLILGSSSLFALEGSYYPIEDDNSNQRLNSFISAGINVGKTQVLSNNELIDKGTFGLSGVGQYLYYPKDSKVFNIGLRAEFDLQFVSVTENNKKIKKALSSGSVDITSGLSFTDNSNVYSGIGYGFGQEDSKSSVVGIMGIDIKAANFIVNPYLNLYVVKNGNTIQSVEGVRIMWKF